MEWIHEVRKNKLTHFYRIFLYYFMFYLVWALFFISHQETFILSAVACIWYFADDRKDLGSPIMKAMSWGFYVHMGTVAFGSLILAIIWLIKESIEHMKQSEGNENCSKFIIECVLCVVRCLETLVEYLSKHAYIETALHGSNFCRAAKDSIIIIKSNFFNIGILHGITGLAVFFGNFCIAALVTVIGWLLLKGVDTFSELVFETMAPLIVKNYFKEVDCVYYRIDFFFLFHGNF